MREAYCLFIILIVATACAYQQIPLERPASSLTAERFLTYRVLKGDTLASISRRYGINLESLKRINKLSKEELTIGQLLFIPKDLKKEILLFDWPVKGEIIKNYGQKINNLSNRGIDIKTEADELVKAAQDGKVIFCRPLKGWGQTIILKHPKDFYTVYTYIRDPLVKEGSSVKRGEPLGKVNPQSNGNYLLHFEIRQRSFASDPLKYLK